MADLSDEANHGGKDDAALPGVVGAVAAMSPGVLATGGLQHQSRLGHAQTPDVRRTCPSCSLRTAIRLFRSLTLPNLPEQNRSTTAQTSV